MERCAARKVLARVMSYEYLWHQIREVGGVYGTGMLTQDGVEYLYTYRDPHLTESYDTFAKGPADLAARDYTEKDMNEFIVGTVAKLDTPRKPYAQAKELDRRYFCGITDGMTAADRAALCAVDADTLKAQAARSCPGRWQRASGWRLAARTLWKPPRACLTGWRRCKSTSERMRDF